MTQNKIYKKITVLNHGIEYCEVVEQLHDRYFVGRNVLTNETRLWITYNDVKYQNATPEEVEQFLLQNEIVKPITYFISIQTSIVSGIWAKDQRLDNLFKNLINQLSPNDLTNESFPLEVKIWKVHGYGSISGRGGLNYIGDCYTKSVNIKWANCGKKLLKEIQKLTDRSDLDYPYLDIPVECFDYEEFIDPDGYILDND